MQTNQTSTTATAPTTAAIKIEIENTRRLRVRRVSEKALANRAITLAMEKGRAVILADHGGGVANKYGYPAETEGVVVVGYPDGTAVGKVVRLPANKVTLSGVFAAISGLRGLFDARFSSAKKQAVRNEFLAQVSSTAAA